MKRLLMVGAGAVAVLVGLGFIMPAVAKMRQQSGLPSVDIGLLLLGILLTLAGVTTAICSLRQVKS